MPSPVDAALEHRLTGHPGLAKLAKYSAASVAGVVANQTVLVACLVLLGWPATAANICAVTAGAIPNYLINRAWTFNKRGSHSFTREVLPFWGMALLGLVVSTLAVTYVDRNDDASAVLVSAANIGSFGVLWLAKFFLLDQFLFRPLVELVETHEDPEGHIHLHAEHPVPEGEHEAPEIWPEPVED